MPIKADKVVIRTPKYSYQELDFILGLSINEFCEYLKNNKELVWDISNSSESIINEYYRQIQKSNSIDKELYKRLIKYIVRAHSRCTPFGTLAAYSTAEIKFSNEPTNIQLCKETSYIKNLNINYLNEFLDSLRSFINIEKCTFKLNPTIYCINKKLRFIKFQNGEYIYSSVDLNEELEIIFKFLQNDFIADFNTLIVLFSELLDKDESKQLIMKLHEEYILLSEIGIHISSRDLLPKVKELFNTNKIIKNNTTKLKYKELLQIENDFHNNLLKSDYNSINTGITIDSIRIVNKVNINNSLLQDINGAIDLLDSFNSDIKDNTHRDLKRKFNHLYENQSIEFLKFIDPQYGFAEETSMIDNNYIKDIFKNLKYGEYQKSQNSLNVSLPSHLNRIYNLLLDSYRKNVTCDLKGINTQKKESKLKRKNFQLSIVSKSEEVSLKYLSSISLFDHISRFNKSGDTYKNIEEKDKSFDKIENYKTAEFLFLPKFEVSNIVCREISDEFDIIPFISFERNRSIQLNHLRIRINNAGKFELFDADTNEIILPIIRNNHNYFNSNIFIYKFLGELQFQYFGSRYRLDIGIFRKLMKIMPRIF